FFFQAEDGIRDDLVTGVQTCALPISCGCVRSQNSRSVFTIWKNGRRSEQDEVTHNAPGEPGAPAAEAGRIYGDGRDRVSGCTNRSEERRVGKEGSSRGWARE